MSERVLCEWCGRAQWADEMVRVKEHALCSQSCAAQVRRSLEAQDPLSPLSEDDFRAAGWPTAEMLEPLS